MGHLHEDATDAELIDGGDGDAFGELYRRRVDEVYGWLRPRSAHLAADLTAETFARAWLGRRRFRDDREGSALPWLLGIARNVLRDSLRRDRVEQRARERLGLPVDLAAEDGFALVEDRLSPRVALARALDALPAHEREALTLRIVEELPYGEVAGRLRIRPAAARLRVSRALRRLALMAPKEEP